MLAFRQHFFFNNRTKKRSIRPIYPGKKRPSPKETQRTTTINATPLSWKQFESKTPASRRNTIRQKTPSPLQPECQLQDETTTSPIHQSCPGNMTASMVLYKYATILDHGHTLNLNYNAFSKKLGDMECRKLKQKLRMLLPYLNCDVCKKIHKIQLYHHDIKLSQLSMVPLLFQSMPQLREIHLGIPSNVSSYRPEALQVKYGNEITFMEQETPTTGKYILARR